MNLTIVNPIVFLALLLDCMTMSAQSYDSLEGKSVGWTDRERLDILSQLTYDLIDNNDTMAMKYAQRTFNLAQALHDSAKLVKSGYHKALLFRRLSRYDSSLMISLRILPIARRLKLHRDLAKILNGLLLDNLKQSRYDKALKYGLECVEIGRRNSGEVELGLFLNNLGLVYYKLENYDRAVPYFLESYTKVSNSEHSDAFLPAHNLSLCYAYKLEMRNALFFLSESRRLSSDSCATSNLALSQFATGLIQFKKGVLDDAKASFNRSLVHSIRVRK